MANTENVSLAKDGTPTIIAKAGDVFDVENKYNEDILYSYNLDADNKNWHTLHADEVISLAADVQIRVQSQHQIGKLIVSNF